MRFGGPITEFEREEARQIQHSLLPAGPLEGPSFEINYRFSPYAGVGGDFADFFELPDGQVGLYVGDIVGKGLPAALYAALVMGMLRGIHKSGQNTATALAVLNERMLVRPLKGRYATTLYAIFDPVSHKLTFSNAGLPYPVLVSESGCSLLGEGGLPSGLFPGAKYESHTVQLSAGRCGALRHRWPSRASRPQRSGLQLGKAAEDMAGVPLQIRRRIAQPPFRGGARVFRGRQRTARRHYRCSPENSRLARFGIKAGALRLRSGQTNSRTLCGSALCNTSLHCHSEARIWQRNLSSSAQVPSGRKKERSLALLGMTALGFRIPEYRTKAVP